MINLTYENSGHNSDNNLVKNSVNISSEKNGLSKNLNRKNLCNYQLKSVIKSANADNTVRQASSAK
ncbi:hypothetical protein PIROE2DRAFT_9877 [Piromyces sp. E2]|nr:hypothetical protein PIROE2DRAFT_9877 [Piromyces sp. E2]|eukprot:OUM63528.1 hypothetical protein PIROE2DRAFT_9877 [Piromyces sp. E2]